MRVQRTNALPAEERERIFPIREPVRMPLGHTVCEPGVPMRHGYSPTTCIVSLLYVMEDGASAEFAVVGNEGIVGVSRFMGGETTTSRAAVQSAGHAYRLQGQLLKDAFFRAGPMQRLLLRYTQALLTQMAQTAACSRHHPVDQQRCRWLLLSLDRLPSNELTMTQALIANMLGVRREGVTEAATAPQQRKLISYRRGDITILDGGGLEATACGCYRGRRGDLYFSLDGVAFWGSTLWVSREAQQVEWLTETRWRREPPDTRGEHRGPRVRRWAGMALGLPPHRLRLIMRLVL
jgi:CRP-like cAMP-binding protein